MIATSQFTISVIKDGKDGAPGATGPQGVSVEKVVREYRLSDSSTEMTGSGDEYTWSETKPKIPSGKYLWERERTDLSNNTSEHGTAHCDIVTSGLVLDVDRNTNAITSKVWESDITTKINEYDGSTGKSIRDRVAKTETDISGINTTISDIQTDVAGKADGSTVTTLTTKVNTISDTVDGHTQTIQNNTSRIDDAEDEIESTKTIASQTADKFTWLVDSGTSASNFTLTSRVAELISPQVVIKDPAGSATIISGGKIHANAITTAMLATDAIKSTNYQASTSASSPYSATGTFLDLGTGTLYMPNFGVNGTTGAAYFNGTVNANAGKFGDDSSYWNIETVYDYDMQPHAALVGTGSPYLQTGNWQVSDNAVATRKYTSTSDSSGNATYYKDSGTNTFYDVGMKIPSNFSAYSASDSSVTKYNKAFYYGRKYTGNNAPSLDSDWTYFFSIDSGGNVITAGDVYEGGVKLSDKYAAITDVGSVYLPKTGGTITGNLSVNGSFTTNLQLQTNLGSTSSAQLTGAANAIVKPGVTGTLGVGNGGTGKSSWTANRLIYSSASNALSELGAGTSGQVLKSNGSSAPSWVNQSTLSVGSATKATQDGDGNVIADTYRTLDNTQFDTVDITDAQIGNLMVTGAGRFTNGLYGDLIGNVVGDVSGSAGSVANNLKIQLNGGTTEGTNQFTFNGSAAKNINITKSSIGLGSVDNTADANKNVLTATKFASAQSITLTGDTTGTASSQAGWSIATTTNKLTSLGRLKSANVDNTSSDYKNKISYFYSSQSMTEGKPPIDGGILNFAWDNNKWGAQLAIKIDTTPHIFIRGNNNTSWDANWLTVLDSNNYNNYAPTKTGTGASGTWGINISGGAATWSTGRTLTIGGTGKTVDGSANVSWSKAEISDTATQSALGWMSADDKKKLDGIAVGAQVNSITGVKGNSESAYRTGNVNITAANIGLGNLTNNKQVKGLSSGTTSGHLVTWGSDGYTVADSGIAKTGVATKLTLAGTDYTVSSNAITVTQANLQSAVQSTDLVLMTAAERTKLTSIQVSSGGTIDFSGVTASSPLTATVAEDKTVNITHNTSGVTAGTYRSVTVNTYGHVTGGTNPTTLSGYGITDAKIASGTITLGSNTITPLTASSTLDATKLSGTASISTTGNASTATTATNVSGTAGTANTAAHVWFSNTSNETQRMYDDDFKYNPSTNTLTVANVTGNAGSATKLTTSAGDWSVPVYFSGGKPVETTYLNLHPENANSMIIPFFNNDWAYLIERGGAYEIYSTTATSFTSTSINKTAISVDLTNAFDASYTYIGVNRPQTETTVIDITCPSTHTYANTFYIDFGSSSWRANSIQVLAYNTATESEYVSKGSITNNTLGHWKLKFSHSSTNTSGTTVQGFNRVRIVLSGWANTQNRIAQIGLVNYGSFGTRLTYMSRGIDDGVYRSITPAKDNHYDLGSSSHKWANVYATTFTGSFSGNATSATSATNDSSGNKIVDTYVKKTGDTMTGNLYIQNAGTNSNDWASRTSNPSLIFRANDGQMAGFIYTQYDSVQAPDSVTLVGAQAGTYFIASNIKATTKFYGDLSGNATTATSATTAASATNATNATYLTHKTLNSTTINNTAGTFAFSGYGDPWDGCDWVGLQVGDNVDKFQITRYDTDTLSGMIYRYNDSGGTNTSWTGWRRLLDENNYSNYAVPKSGGAFTGAVTGTSFAASSYLAANSGSNGSAGGLALWGTNNPTIYGIAMRTTANGGKHGYVQGDYGIYSYMAGTNDTNKLTRGWILKNATDNVGVASVSGAGHAVFNGSVTVGGNETNTSGCRQEFDADLQCLNFIFN